MRRRFTFVRFSPHIRRLISVAWPIALAMLGQASMGLVDVALVAGFGASALAGVGVAIVFAHLFFACVFGLMRAVKVLTARAVGAGRDDASRFALAGAALGVVIGLGVLLFCRALPAVLGVLGVDATAVPFAEDFLSARSWGAPLLCAMSALVQYRQGLGDSRLPMVVGLGANAINAGLSYVLASGHLGLPALGVAGVGYGTVVAEGFALSILAIVVARDVRRAGRPRGRSMLRAIREIGRVGVPTGLQFGFEMLAFAVLVAVLAGVGAKQLAAHHVALNLVRFAILPAFAVAEAGCVLVGQALGRQHIGRADRYARVGVWLAAAVAALVGIGMIGAGAAITGALSDDPEVGRLVRRLLWLAALFLALDAVYLVHRANLRAAEDVRWPGLVGAALAWICIPGAALVLGRWAELGAVGAWLGFLAESALGAALLARRWGKSPFRRAKAGDRSPFRRAAA